MGRRRPGERNRDSWPHCLCRGNFDRAISPTGSYVPRRNLAAFSIVTGELVTSFRADAGSTVTSLATDGEGLYVGGHFGRIQGMPRLRVAKVSLSTGLVDSTFRADANAGVLALDVRDGSLYVGGNFTTINSTTRSRIARLDASSGSVNPDFQASANGAVRAVTTSPETPTVYVAGTFSSLGGTPRNGVGALSSLTGAAQGPAFSGSVRPALDLALSPDGALLFC